MKHRLQWDIFCKVIDNFGDIGVCWRLAADLAARGQGVRLWVDDASALDWMAPGGCPGVQVLPWDSPLALDKARLAEQPCEVLIESFGCETAPEFIAACADATCASGLKPLWINLEYLSAEPYVARCHALPSPVQHGPAAGWIKWFFYPGFTQATGGLLRESDLAGRQAQFDRSGWLASQGIAWTGQEKLVSLFCYEPPALGALLVQLSRCGLHGQPVHLLVAAGRATQAVKAKNDDKNGLQRNEHVHKLLSISYLPLLTQQHFDHLLWASDLNFVRGEDSLVRALWAGSPFVWQVYPQHDGAHLEKLNALMDVLEAPPSLRAFHQAWNGPPANSDPALSRSALPAPDLPAWQACAQSARTRLMAQDDLCARLQGFVAKNR